jgi:DNA (cytosine-5)-methyltransferase 1
MGWQAVAFAEINQFPSAVLAHHYPETRNLGDFTKIQANEAGPIDLLVGGTPCQDFSIAGLRAGVAGERGNLTLEFLRLAQRLRPRWLVWENVPGVYSATSNDAPDHSHDGDGRWQDDANESHAFACFLAGLQKLGYGFAYRTLDAQYFGVPQRRRRVFVVGHLGDWHRSAAVLFERQSMSGDTPPCREARKDVAPPP